MNSLTKKEIEKAIERLRKGKDDSGSYTIVSPHMAMCYSVRFPKYDVSYYPGKHICNCCKKEFGADLKDSIAACREKRCSQYLLSDKDSILVPRKACFRSFLDSYKKADPEPLHYLEERHLKVTFAKPQKRVFFHGGLSEVECSFNRKLSYDEWMALNTDCYLERNSYGMETTGICSQCFEYDKSYQVYEQMAENYNKAGFDVILKYNCEECCKDGKRELEFWLKVNGTYLISYPIKKHREMAADAARYNDYSIVLEFLKGKTDYAELIGEHNDEIVEKCDIDRALNAILKSNIVYDKNEIREHFVAVYFNCRGYKWDGKELEQRLKEDYTNEVLSKYPDDYRFSPEECSKLMSEYRSFLYKY